MFLIWKQQNANSNDSMTNQQAHARMRKYDAYIPPAETLRSRYAEPSQPVAPVVAHVQAVDNIVKQPQIYSNFTPKQVIKSEFKKSVFSSIINATVQIEKVTRQSVHAVKHSFEPPEIEYFRSKKQRYFTRSFYLVGIASFVFAVLALTTNIIGAKAKPLTVGGVLGAQVDTQNDANRLSEIPTENKPSQQDMKTYLVTYQYPRYLRVPSLGIDARIRRLGIDSKGQVGTPNNIFDSGWYDGSSKPGEKEGSSIIVGHVSGPSTHGVFWDIDSIAINAVIEIEKGNGEILKYKVSRIDRTVSSDIDLNHYLKPDYGMKTDLKLITSSGKYDKVDAQYAGRTIVIAVPL